MNRGPRIAIAVALAAAAGSAALAWRAARRDQAVLEAAFAADHLSRVRMAAQQAEADFVEAGRDLEFTARLVANADTLRSRERELVALLAVERPYRQVVVLDRDGSVALRAVDPKLPADWSPAPFEAAVADTARRAVAAGAPAFSGVLEGERSSWYRVLASPVNPAHPEQGAVAILVDLAEAFGRLRVLAPEPGGRLLVLAPDGTPAPLTAPQLAARIAAGERTAGLGRLLAAVGGSASGVITLSPAEAGALGAPDTDLVAAWSRIVAGPGDRWSVAVLDSTDVLRSQERSVVLQLAAGGAAAAVALSVLATFLVLGARRAAVVQGRLEAAEQMAHLREKAEKILETVPVAVISLDEGLAISGLNRAARERVAATATGGPLEAAFPRAGPDVLAALRAAAAAARGTGEVQALATAPLALEGEDSCFAVHAVPLAHPLPDVSVLLVLADLGELRALSSQLLRAEKLATVGVLAAGIAHEIGTPLGIVRGRAERIAAKLGAEHPLAPGARTIVEEIDRVSRIIRELLDYSRLSKASAVPVAVETVARAVLDLLALQARARGVSVALELPGALPPVAADPDQLQQVLVNLVMNGVDACGSGGRVVVRASPDSAGRALIEVEDDGAGIPDELRNRVFDPFFTTKKRGQGTGLGLAVVARLVRNHGGEVELDSAVGRGTRVRILWPLARSGREETDGTPERRIHPGGG